MQIAQRPGDLMEGWKHPTNATGMWLLVVLSVGVFELFWSVIFKLSVQVDLLRSPTNLNVYVAYIFVYV